VRQTKWKCSYSEFLLLLAVISRRGKCLAGILNQEETIHICIETETQMTRRFDLHSCCKAPRLRKHPPGLSPLKPPTRVVAGLVPQEFILSGIRNDGAITVLLSNTRLPFGGCGMGWAASIKDIQHVRRLGHLIQLVKVTLCIVPVTAAGANHAVLRRSVRSRRWFSPSHGNNG
jgi:hypothetical protein